LRLRLRLVAVLAVTALSSAGAVALPSVTKARLLLVEALVPELAVDGPEAIRMDIHMLMLFGARERTDAEYRALLDGAGFRAAARRAERLAGRPERARGDRCAVRAPVAPTGRCPTIG
jgi:hypothetical protein